MTVQNWDEFASLLAGFVRKNLPAVYRGAFLVPYPVHKEMYVVVFGNQCDGSVRTRLEMEVVRRRLKQAPYEELGHGANNDATSWALLCRAPFHAYQTPLGQAFQKEMLRANLEEVVWGSAANFGEVPLVEVAEAQLAR